LIERQLLPLTPRIEETRVTERWSHDRLGAWVKLFVNAGQGRLHSACACSVGGAEKYGGISRGAPSRGRRGEPLQRQSGVPDIAGVATTLQSVSIGAPRQVDILLLPGN
jgi:hypothetical protein